MGDWPLMQVVSRPEPSAPILADLNDGGVVIARHEGFSLGEPEVTLADDGMVLWGRRQITVPLLLRGTRQEVSAALSRIGRHLVSRAERWLRFQLTPSSPLTFARLRPTSPGELGFSRIFLDDRQDVPLGDWQWDLTLEADATTQGVSQRLADALTIRNDMERGRVIDCPGEVPTPARIQLTPDRDWLGRRVLVHVAAVEEGSTLYTGSGDARRPRLLMSEQNLTPQGDATRVTGETGRLGGGTGIAIPMGNTSARTVAQGVLPFSPPPGRYSVWVRLYRKSSAGAIRIRMGQMHGPIASWQPWSADPSFPSWWRPTPGGWRSSWHRIGLIVHPLGLRWDGLADGDPIAPTVALQAMGDGSAGDVMLDQLLFLPTSLASGICTTWTGTYAPGVGPAAAAYRPVVDARYGRVEHRDGFGRIHPVPSPQVAGGWPMLTPGMVNIVTVLMATEPTPDLRDDLDASTMVTIDAAPRHLHLAGV